jgi:CRISPR-associated protein Cas1
MTASRILEFSATPVFVRLRLGQMVIERDGQPEATLPLEDVAIIVVSHPQAVFTNAVYSEFLKLGGAVVLCDQHHNPAGMLLPLVGHSTQQERFEAQAGAPLPLKKRLWGRIVRAKLERQGALLRDVHGDDAGLGAMALRVRSGDAGNLEALAAQRYWPRLFGDPDFRRRRDGDPPNALLNYGYAVLRAAVARAICASGLHPSLGLHHCNRYDAFCLADDLMEPFRPVVDAAVASIVRARGMEAPVDREFKIEILSVLSGRFDASGERRTLFDWLSSSAASLARIYSGSRESLELPELAYAPPRKEPVRDSSHVADGDVRSAG